MSKLDTLLEKAQKSMGLDIRSAREQCQEDTLFLDSPGLNYILGGGLKLTRAYLLHGPFSAGKSALACYLASQVQKKRETQKIIAYMDIEYSLDIEHAAEMGLDVDHNFILLRPKSAEDMFNLIQELTETKEIGMIIIDSLSSLESRAQLEDAFGGFGGSKGAIAVASGMKKIIPYLYNNKCPLVMIAQERANVGGMYGPDFTIASAGNAPKFYASFIARVTRVEDILDESKDVIGINMKIKASKNKLGNPKRVCTTKLLFKGGVNSEEEYLDYLVNLGIVKKTGAMYEVENDAWGMGKVRGIEAVKTFLKEHPDIYEKVKLQINEALAGHTVLDDMIIDDETGEILNMDELEAEYASDDVLPEEVLEG